MKKFEFVGDALKSVKTGDTSRDAKTVGDP